MNNSITITTDNMQIVVTPKEGYVASVGKNNEVSLMPAVDAITFTEDELRNYAIQAAKNKITDVRVSSIVKELRPNVPNRTIGMCRAMGIAFQRYFFKDKTTMTYNGEGFSITRTPAMDDRNRQYFSYSFATNKTKGK